jgi:hypothetical protein
LKEKSEESVHGNPSLNSRTRFPGYFQGAAERQNNIIVRASGDTVQFAQPDDLDKAKLKRVADGGLPDAADQSRQSPGAGSGVRPQQLRGN